jgi:hypothetical protein
VEFGCAGRLGRRKADPCGHLFVTREGVQFRGAHDVDLRWRDIGAVDRAERAIVVTLRNTSAVINLSDAIQGRCLHFCCPTEDEATRGVSIARGLLSAEASNRAGPTEALA